MVSYLLTFRLVAQFGGHRAFDEYSLSRRALALLLPIASVGMDVAVARQVAYSTGLGRDQRSPSYPLAGLAVAAVASALLALAILVTAPGSAWLLYGLPNLSGLLRGLSAATAGAALHAVAYGSLRGQLRIQRANLLMVIVHGVCPPLAVVITGGDVAPLLTLLGAAWTVVSLVFFITSLAGRPPALAGLLRDSRSLIAYSGPRVPGDLLQLALFALPGVAAARLGGVATGGAVAFAVVALGVVGSAAFPINFVLLPVAARHLGGGGLDELRQQVRAIAQVSAIVLVAGTIAVELLAPVLVPLYLGSAYRDVVPWLQLVMLAALPWGGYMSFKGIVDAHRTAPVNARNTAIAFVFFVIVGAVAYGRGSLLAIVLGFVASVYVLGALTAWEVRRAVISVPGTDS